MARAVGRHKPSSEGAIVTFVKQIQVNADLQVRIRDDVARIYQRHECEVCGLTFSRDELLKAHTSTTGQPIHKDCDNDRR